MPLKDPIARAEYRKKYYTENSIRLIAQTSACRRAKAAEVKEAKKLLPQAVILRVCQDCGVDITEVYIPKHGCHCKACVAIYNRAYRSANTARIAQQKKQWAIVNAEYKAEQDRRYALAHPEKRTLARNKWNTANPGMNNAAKAKNRIARAKRVPSWLTEDDKWLIDQAYELASLRTKMLGFAWHVDHIIPLNGRRVSGLHVPYNIRVIPGVENLRKGNRYSHE